MVVVQAWVDALFSNLPKHRYVVDAAPMTAHTYILTSVICQLRAGCGCILHVSVLVVPPFIRDRSLDEPAQPTSTSRQSRRCGRVLVKGVAEGNPSSMMASDDLPLCKSLGGCYRWLGIFSQSTRVQLEAVWHRPSPLVARAPAQASHHRPLHKMQLSLCGSTFFRPPNRQGCRMLLYVCAG